MLFIISQGNAHLHWDTLASMREALTDESRRAEAAELIRTLIDRIVLTPVDHDGRETLTIDRHGHIAGILSLASDAKKPPRGDGFSEESIKLVAGEEATENQTRWSWPFRSRAHNQRFLLLAENETSVPEHE